MYFIGISIGICDPALSPPALKAAVLKKEGNTLAVESLQEFPADADKVKPFYNLVPFHSSKEVHISSGLSGSQVFIRSLHLPLTEKHKILAALPFQCETLLPFPLESAVICPQLKQIGKKMTAIVLYATTHASLLRHIALLDDLHIQCDAVSCAPAALARFAHWQFPQAQKILAFHVQDNALLYTLSFQEEVLFSQTLPMKDLSIELQKLEIFLKERGMIDEQTPWLITGEGESDAFAQIFTGEQLVVKDPQTRSFALAIGLALDAVANDALTIQFAKEQFTPLHTKKKRKKLLLTYLGICFIASLLAAGTGALLTGKKQRVLSQRLKNELPKEIAFDPHSSLDAIETSLHRWESSLNKQKSSFPFHPTVPKVSDILAWLSSDPRFASEDGGKKEGIDIRSLHYQLVKYPKIGEAGSPYLATLDIDFTSDTPRLARDFHEELLKGSSLVNAKKEVRWHVQNQNYHTSFELNKGDAQ